jgi:hypothetical protein
LICPPGGRVTHGNSNSATAAILGTLPASATILLLLNICGRKFKKFLHAQFIPTNFAICR